MHFISGLPRSGSTLLASILNQCPDFHASIETPVGSLVSHALSAMGPANEAEGFITDEQKVRILRGIFEHYYMGQKAKLVFDNNRRWCANMALLAKLYPDASVICCVRSPAAIVDSFERLFQKNSLHLSVIYNSLCNVTVYERAFELMKPQGVVGFSLNALRSAYYGPYRNRVILVPYDDLARYPAEVMRDLHVSLNLPPHTYDFNRIEPIPGAVEFDQKIRTPGLHTLKPKVVYERRDSVLPPDIYATLPPPFWEVKKEATPAG